MADDEPVAETDSEIAVLREQLEEALRNTKRLESTSLLATEELNRRIIEAMPGGIVHVAKDGAILTANEAAMKVLGLSYDALSRRYVADFDQETIWEDGSPCPASDYPVTKALLTGEPQPPVVIGVRRQDGALSWAVFTAVPVRDPSCGAVTGAIVTFLDITGRKHLESSRLRSEGLLQSIMDSTPNPIVSADLEGRVVFAAQLPAFIPKEALIGQPVWSPSPPESQARLRECHARVVSSGELQTVRLEGPQGSKWWARAAPRYEDNKIVGVTYSVWDVTKEKELEARLSVTDRLASLGTLAAGVAHELNNPLTYLLGSLDALVHHEGPLSQEVLHANLFAALDGAARIRRVVADLGSYTRIGEGAHTLSDARELLDSAIRLAGSLIRFRATVKRLYPAGPAWVADDGRLAQVFLNLVVNAAQAIEEGAAESNTIEVRIEPAPDGPTAIVVSDTGTGMSPEVLARVFDPFFTTKANRSGTGLGLFICRNVVEALDGEITLSSTLGSGTTFRVVLPAMLSSAAPERSSLREPGSEGAELGRLRILVADDEHAILQVMKSLLRAHELVTVRDGREAIEMLCNEEFDLALCDLVMPETDGVEVFEEVKRRCPGRERRLILMTGGAFTERTQRFLRTAANPVLKKPFSRDELQDAVLAHVRLLKSE